MFSTNATPQINIATQGRFPAILFVLSLLIALSGCAIPLMELDHVSYIGVTYSIKGTLKVDQFEDRRPSEEKVESQTALNKITPQIWSGSTNPDMMFFFQQTLIEEAKRTKLFVVGNDAEYELSGYITSMKVDRTVSIMGYLVPILGNAKLAATVRFHANLKRNGALIFEKDIKQIKEDSYWIMTEGGWKTVSKKASKLLDETISKSIRKLFDEIETSV